MEEEKKWIEGFNVKIYTDMVNDCSNMVEATLHPDEVGKSLSWVELKDAINYLVKACETIDKINAEYEEIIEIVKNLQLIDDYLKTQKDRLK